MLSAVVVIASSVTALRLITYHRGASQYCFFKSLVAYSLIVLFGGQAIHIMINHAQVTPLQAVATLIVMGLVLRARGNVWCVFRREH